MKADDRRGVALIIAVAVLTAMFLMAVPFAVFMRLQHSAGTQALHTGRARHGYAGALGYARNVLYQGLDEYENGAWVDTPMFPFDDPDVDTPWEFRVTMRTRLTGGGIGTGAADLPLATALGFPNDGDDTTVDGYVRVGEEWMAYSHIRELDPSAADFPAGTLEVAQHHRGLLGTEEIAHNGGELVSVFPDLEMWQLDVQDQQALINVNTAPYQVIVNLLGYLGIGDGSPPPAPGDGTFPGDRQAGLAAAISSYRLYYSYWENDDDGDGIETPSEDNITDGTYTRFQNLQAIRNVSKAPWLGGTGTATLSAEEFDLLRPYLTVHSEIPGHTWWSPTGSNLAGNLNGASANTQYWAIQVTDASRIPLGSIARLYDSDYDRPPVRMVNSVTSDVTLGAALNATDEGWVPVSGDLSHFSLLASTTSPATTPHTPGYLYIEDDPAVPGDDSEWIACSDVDKTVGSERIYISERAVWGPSAAHAAGLTMQGNTIGWRYDDGTGGNSNESTNATSYTPPVGETIDEGPVQLERRHALNVNTVNDPIILQALLYGVADEVGGTVYDISADEAEDLALSLLAFRADGTAPSLSPPEPPYEFFDGDEIWFDPGESDWSNHPGAGSGSDADLQDFFDAKCVDAGIIGSEEADILIRNFKHIEDLQADGADWPEVSTCPLRFNSGNLTGLASMGMADDRAQTPVAQYPRLAQERVYDTVPPLEGLYWTIRSQKEFLTTAGTTRGEL
ncbi:MAG: hypothetical protein R6V05_04300, partial [Candidatus Brocadiia bacterium]